MSYDFLLQKALALYDAGQLDDAEVIYRQILDTVPEQPDVLNLLGLVAQAKGAHAEACAIFAKALRNKKDDLAIVYNLAYSLYCDGKLHEALNYFEKVLTIKPDLKEAYNQIGLIFADLQDLDKARQNWLKALGIDISYVSARVNWAKSFEKDNPIKAIEELEKVAVSFPEDASVWYYLGKIYFKQKNYIKAWNAAMKAKEKAPTSDEVRVLLAWLSLQENQFDNAKIYFAKALLLNPNNVDALLGLANINSREDNFDEAEKNYLKASEIAPNDFDMHNNYAEMRYRQNRLSEALEEYRKAVIINPKSAEVNNNIALILKDQGEYEEALGLLFNAFLLKPDLDEVSINLAETLIMYFRKEPKKAIALAEKWLNYAPNNDFAKHLYASFKGQKNENNKIYVQKLFDNFADNYELVMQNLDYTTPLVMGRIAGSIKGTIVDLGCGTGLLGKALKSSENKIIGVDLSDKMLGKAKEKGVYDNLIKADVIDYLKQNRDFDWVVAADVFGYIGDLSEIIALCKGKNMLFSTENAFNADDFEIFESGRYRHNYDYVLTLLKNNGFDDIIPTRLVLRNENGNGVEGTICKALTK